MKTSGRDKGDGCLRKELCRFLTEAPETWGISSFKIKCKQLFSLWLVSPRKEPSGMPGLPRMAAWTEGSLLFSLGCEPSTETTALLSFGSGHTCEPECFPGLTGQAGSPGAPIPPPLPTMAFCTRLLGNIQLRVTTCECLFGAQRGSRERAGNITVLTSPAVVGPLSPHQVPKSPCHTPSGWPIPGSVVKDTSSRAQTCRAGLR